MPSTEIFSILIIQTILIFNNVQLSEVFTLLKDLHTCYTILIVAQRLK